MTHAAQAARRVLSHLSQRILLEEHVGAARGPWLSVGGMGATRGHVHVHTATGLDKVVFLTLEDGEQLDAAMLMAFGSSHTAQPHLVLDVARVARQYAVFVDLLPRVDLAVHPSYVREIYAPLDAVVDGLARHPQLVASPVPHSLRPYVSPWMTGFRCSTEHLQQLFEFVAPYVSGWLDLLMHGLPPVRHTTHELSRRDILHRENLFSAIADPVWDVLDTLIGEDNAQRVLSLLHSHGAPPSPSGPPPPPIPRLSRRPSG